MARLLCWFGWHAWQPDGVVYASPSWVCQRCGRREARAEEWPRCEQCGHAVASDTDQCQCPRIPVGATQYRAQE